MSVHLAFEDVLSVYILTHIQMFRFLVSSFIRLFRMNKLKSIIFDQLLTSYNKCFKSF